MSYSKRELDDLNVMLADMSRIVGDVIAEGNRMEEARTEEWEDHEHTDNWTHSGYSKQTGAMRRKSMDLTRALAELRKP